MAKTEALTDRLLQAKLGQSLPQFIADQTRLGADTTAIQASLLIATGEMYDRRMVQKWMDVYQ